MSGSKTNKYPDPPAKKVEVAPAAEPQSPGLRNWLPPEQHFDDLSKLLNKFTLAQEQRPVEQPTVDKKTEAASEDALKKQVEAVGEVCKLTKENLARAMKEVEAVDARGARERRREKKKAVVTAWELVPDHLGDEWELVEDETEKDVEEMVVVVEPEVGEMVKIG
jgi:hypothetical protein